MIHRNSIVSYRSITDLGDRHRRIYELFLMRGYPMTDRDVKLAGRFEDMNLVRPRITELVDLGILVECGSVVDPETKRMVRQCRIRQAIDSNGVQLRMF
ncbi:MAG: hypothetical protein GYA69_04795 [Candidatus Moranbacteria bacterium]|nr:hypothetical protein [Candidatus Moranbacteria bacterium]